MGRKLLDRLEIGQRVYWNDPESISSSFYYVVGFNDSDEKYMDFDEENPDQIILIASKYHQSEAEVTIDELEDYDEASEWLAKEHGYEVTTEEIPTWALCYIFNGDADGLGEEHLKEVEDWYDRVFYSKGYEIIGESVVEDIDGNWNESFSPYPAFGLASDVVDVEILYKKNDKKNEE